MRHVIRKLTVVLGTVISIATLAAGLSAGPAASAAQTTAASRPVTVVRVPMTLDCAKLAGSAASYAHEHGYCTSKQHGITPDNAVVGDCGTSFIYLTNGGGGDGRFAYGFASSQGEVVYRGLTVTWVNWSRTNYGGSFPDNSFMASPNYSTLRVDYTASGYVTTNLSGYVVLWWGGTCDLEYPSAGVTIT
jgi:hypothetical protein